MDIKYFTVNSKKNALYKILHNIPIAKNTNI